MLSSALRKEGKTWSEIALTPMPAEALSVSRSPHDLSGIWLSTYTYYSTSRETTSKATTTWFFNRTGVTCEDRACRTKRTLS